MNTQPLIVTQSTPPLPRDGESWLDANGQIKIFYRNEWMEPHILPAQGAIAYLQRQREKRDAERKEVA